jgi:hypothetical protein
MAKEKNEQAKWAVIREWDNWIKNNPDEAKAPTMNGMYFFTYLQKEKSELLEFRYPGDKWQAVHGWLLREHRVKD